MGNSIQSQAFEDALLRTERLRISGVIIVVVVFGVTSAVRIALFGSHMNHIGVYAAIGFIGYELIVLNSVNRSIKSGSRIPDWFWTVNVIVEMSMAAIALAFLPSERLIQDYRPLASSWALLFFPLLILSTLRLSSLVSSVAGLAGAVGYMLAARHHGWHIKSDLLATPVTHSAVPFFAVMIFTSGIIAAVVARNTQASASSPARSGDRTAVETNAARSLHRPLDPAVVVA